MIISFAWTWEAAKAHRKKCTRGAAGGIDAEMGDWRDFTFAG